MTSVCGMMSILVTLQRRQDHGGDQIWKPHDSRYHFTFIQCNLILLNPTHHSLWLLREKATVVQRRKTCNRKQSWFHVVSKVTRINLPSVCQPITQNLVNGYDTCLTPSHQRFVMVPLSITSFHYRRWAVSYRVNTPLHRTSHLGRWHLHRRHARLGIIRNLTEASRNWPSRWGAKIYIVCILLHRTFRRDKPHLHHCRDSSKQLRTLSSQIAFVTWKDSQPVISSGAAIVYAVSVIRTRTENRILMSTWRLLGWIGYQRLDWIPKKGFSVGFWVIWIWRGQMIVLWEECRWLSTGYDLMFVLSTSGWLRLYTCWRRLISQLDCKEELTSATLETVHWWSLFLKAYSLKISEVKCVLTSYSCSSFLFLKPWSVLVTSSMFFSLNAIKFFFYLKSARWNTVLDDSTR